MPNKFDLSERIGQIEYDIMILQRLIFGLYMMAIFGFIKLI